MNLMQEEGWEDIPYKRKKKKKTPVKKADHKHNYQPILLIGDKDCISTREDYSCVIGYYCPKCGKYTRFLNKKDYLGNDSVMAKLQELIVVELGMPCDHLFGTFRIPKSTFVSKEAIADRLSHILPCYVLKSQEDSFWVKQVDLDKIIK